MATARMRLSMTFPSTRLRGSAWVVKATRRVPPLGSRTFVSRTKFLRIRRAVPPCGVPRRCSLQSETIARSVGSGQVRRTGHARAGSDRASKDGLTARVVHRRGALDVLDAEHGQLEGAARPLDL